MNAEEARRLTREANAPGSPLVAPVVEAIKDRIRKAIAERGASSITHPFDCLPAGMCGLVGPPPAVREGVLAALRAEGYSVEVHPDQDPGDPRSSGEYVEISW